MIKAHKIQRSLSWICLSLAVGAASLAVFGVPIPYLSSFTVGSLPKQNLRPAEVLGSESPVLGRADAPFKLVMFGDYQCPPCRKEWPKVEQAYRSNSSRLAVFFRSFPLTSIHPQAFDAAVAVEQAKDQGRFLSVHRQLYSDQKALYSIQELLRANGVKTTSETNILRFKQAVVESMSAASRLGVSSTPTLFLISPEGSVFFLPDLDHLRSML